MTLDELRIALRTVLVAEDTQEVDWALVEAFCLETIGRLNREGEPEYPHDVVYRFLDDADIRRQDADYAKIQRERLMAWLDTPNSQA